MTTTLDIAGTDGTAGTDGAVPGDGSAGQDVSSSYAGALNDSLAFSVEGGTGGIGGNATGSTHDGGAGGAGGDATATVDSLTFVPPGGNFEIEVTATGGAAGAPGSGIGGGSTGLGGDGGSASAFVTNDSLTFASGSSSSVTLEAIATGGLASSVSAHNGDATAHVSGNLIDMSLLNTGTLLLGAFANTDPATAGPNPVGDAQISGNTVHGVANGMEADISLSGTQFTLTNNDFSLGAGNDNFVINLDDNSAVGSSLTFSGNTFDGGTGVNSLTLQTSSNLLSAPIVIDLSAHTFDINGASSTIDNVRDVSISYLDSIATPAVTITGDSGDNTLTTDAGNDTLNGGSGADHLIGSAGNDLLDGGVGADIQEGGAGTDTASYADATIAVIASLTTPASNTGDAAGDTYFSIENLTGSAFGDTLTGNSASVGGNGVNTLSGLGGDDVLLGDGGADVLDGGTGTDTASYADAMAAVTANLMTPASNTGEAGGDSYISIENLTGSTFSDTLTGDNGANALTGLNGDDVLQGHAGADVLNGGIGTDTATYINALAGVVANMTTTASNTGEAAGDSYIAIENLSGSNFTDVLTGNSGANVISGFGGDDVLQGRAGADVLDGGAGTNTASYADATAGVVASLTTPSSNTNEAAGDSYISIQNLTGSSHNDTLTGDSHNNVITGGAGADAMNGMGGIDTVSYSTATAGVVANMATPASNTGDAAGDTYASIENLSGSAFNDTLAGDAHANTLSGLGGDDVLLGHAGADVLDGGKGTDTASYADAPTGVIANLSAPSSNTGDAAGDTYISIENLTGSSHNDTLTGDDHANVLMGGGGGDVLNGLSGLDTASYANATAAVLASLAAPGSNSGDALGDTYASIENLTGSNFNDALVGNGGANVLSGLNGDDVLLGHAGADVLDGGTGSDTASYADAALAVIASLANPASNTGDAAGDTYISIENLTGSANNDTLTGDSHDNVISGGAGADAMDGGGGNDTASYADATARVVVDLVAGFPFTSGDAVGDTFTSIENLIGSAFDDILLGDGGTNILSGGGGNDLLESDVGADTLRGGAGDDSLYGGAGADHLFGDAGNDVLIGDAGADALDGGSGINTASYLDAVAAIVANLTTPGLNTGDAAGDTYTSIQNLTGSGYADTLTGDSGANVISGNGGADMLSGLSGNDTLIGGAGGDVLNGGTGTDSVSYADATAGLVANMTTPSLNTGDATGDSYVAIENLTGSGYADTLTGNGAANTITGGGGNDTLQGRAGADVLNGGAGINTASYADAPVAVIANMTTPASNTGDAAGDTYIAIRDLTGSSHNDTLTGDGQDNVITGGAGNDAIYGLGGDDTLIGGLGGDALNGGTGTDTASYEKATAGVHASLTSPSTNTGEAAGDTYNSVENMITTRFNDILVGDAGNNTLGVSHDTFYGGYDVLQGMGGNDTLLAGAYGCTLDGGTGNDTASYYWTSSNITWDLTVTGPQDGSATLISIENLSSGIGNDDLSGDAGANVLFGDDGNDVLRGRGGADVLNGGNGLDTASYSDSTVGVSASLTAPTSNTGDAAGDTYISIENLTGSGLNDTLTGNGSANTINGGGGNDTISGGGGTDMLNGGAGADHLTGGSAADVFVYAAASDSTNTAYDTVTGFNALVDKLDVPGTISGINAALTTGALSTATFNADLATDITAAHLGAHHAIAFTPNAGSLAGDHFLIVDVNGTAGYQAGADLVILLSAPTNMASLGAADFI